MRLREVRTHSYWHGTEKKHLKELEPVYSALVDKNVVFAATYPEVAVAMSGHWMDTDFRFGRTTRRGEDPETVPYVLKEKREGAFEEFFSDPISVYEVDGKSFHGDANIQDFEVISTKPVKVVEEHNVEDPLDYLKNSRMVRLHRYQDR